MIITLILSCFIWFELVDIVVYGKYLSAKTCEKYLNLDSTSLRLNIFDSSILTGGGMDTFIATIPFKPSILGKYYIDGVGIVPRWSKLHKRINEYYKIAKNNSNG
jgi:hypothetical protein